MENDNGLGIIKDNINKIVNENEENINFLITKKEIYEIKDYLKNIEFSGKINFKTTYNSGLMILKIE